MADEHVIASSLNALIADNRELRNADEVRRWQLVINDLPALSSGATLLGSWTCDRDQPY
jgi:hypothetical protein